MLIKDAMTPNPEYITPDKTVQQAAERMRDLDVGMIPVGDGVKLKGIITDRDIVVRSTAEGKDPKEAEASSAMTPDILYLFEDQELDDAVQTMKDKQVRRIIILNRDKDMTGVLAMADLANRSGDESEIAEALEGVSEH
ncbi:MAG: CBS domain-containing protein [Oceanipulchritudo sp.]